VTHIFISYNREDQYRARMIADGLEGEGLPVWWDTNLRAGESYDEVTEKHLREAGAVVVLWSKRSVNSKWVRAEATVGERFSKLVPAMIDNCERPLRFELVQTADLTNWHGDKNDPNWKFFIEDVKTAVGHSEVSAPPPPAQTSSPNDVTIENTFWNSIKDGTEPAEFEAYLKRFPDGNFSDLARSRLAALQRPKAQPAPPRQSAPPRPAAPPPPPRQEPPRAAAPARPAAPQPVHQPAPEPKSGGSALPLILGVLALAIVGGGAAFFFLSGDKGGETKVATTEQQPVETAAVVEAPAEPEPAVVDTGEDAVDQLATEEDETLATELAEGEVAPGDAAPSEETGAEAVAKATPAPKPAAPSGPDSFTDCEMCPSMQVLPGGTYSMGSPSDEPGRFGYEGPQHDVTIKRFAISKYEVSFDQWQACVDDGGCGAYTPGDAGFGRGSRPALFISWRDAKSYITWLSNKTGKNYRLPTEAEWEYAARGGTQTAYWWGATFNRSNIALGSTKPAEELKPNPFGLYGMLGNAGEWVEDCYVNNYSEAPVDGSPVTSGDCGRRVIRGGSWRDDQNAVRTANRGRITQTIRDRSMGFRVALSID